MADLDRAIGMNDSRAFTYRERALVWKAKKEYDKAIADCDAAVERDSTTTSLRIRGLVRKAMRQYDEAIDDFTAAIEKNGSDAQAYHRRGDVLHLQGRSDEAVADYERSLELRPGNRFVIRHLGELRFLAGDREGALRYFEEACEASPDDADYARIFCYMLRSRGAGTGSDEAAARSLRSYTEIRKGVPDGETDWPLRVIEFLLGDLAEEELLAGARAEDVETESTRQCEAYFYSGWRRLQAGDRDGARRQFANCRATGRVDLAEHQFAGKLLDGSRYH